VVTSDPPDRVVTRAKVFDPDTGRELDWVMVTTWRVALDSGGYRAVVEREAIERPTWWREFHRTEEKSA
jgi:hypothetical protein